MSADLALAADPSVVERAADPGEYIVQCCERGKWWLKAALERDDMEAVLEAKAQAEAIRVYTVSKGYGADAKLSAEEIIRRAERGLALAVRKGQENGTVRTTGTDAFQGNQHVRGIDNDDTNTTSPGDWVGYGGTRTETYAMTDGVSDKDFEDGLAKAKTEENLSRANVARKVRALANGQPVPSSPRGDRGGRPPRGQSSRRPLPDFANEVGWSLRKDIEKLERIFADDRFAYNKQQVATQVRGHLTYAIQVCQDLLDRINQTPGE